MKYTLDQIKSLLSTNIKWQLRGLVCVYDNQTDLEKATQTNKLFNDKGFTSFDVAILSDLAKTYITSGKLSDKQLVIVSHRIPKYAKQVLHKVNKFQ